MDDVQWRVVKSLCRNELPSEQDLLIAVKEDYRIYNLVKEPSEELTKLYRLLTL